ncbi:MAG: hypothetical protein P4L22_01630 [Candidatus Babeliales bacterium]|nr:hypothetical protein [Candidatus Babeliales bacterium]
MKSLKQLILFFIMGMNIMQIDAAQENMSAEDYNKITKSAEQRGMYSRDYTELILSACIGFIDKFELISHELGHAITAKTFNGSPIDINLGEIIKIGDAQQYLFKLLGIMVNGFENYGATNHRIYNNESNKKLKFFLIKLMGPVFGITSLIIMKSLLNKFIKSNDTSSLNLYLKFLRLICNIRIAVETFYGLTPFNSTKKGDGYQIWKLLDSNEKYIGKIPIEYISNLHGFMKPLRLA